MNPETLNLLKRSRNLLSQPASWWRYTQVNRRELIAELDVALHQPPPEPVAWMCSDEELCRKGYSRFSRNCEGDWNIPVYTQPPSQESRLRYDILHEYADLHKLNYNDLCRVVRQSLTKEKTND